MSASGKLQRQNVKRGGWTAVRLLVMVLVLLLAGCDI